MFTDDLIQPDTDKDVSKSCVFDFPDRPPDTLPPEFPPVDPPDCYPYCSSDDWPPFIPPPPPPIVIPPDSFPHDGAGLLWSGSFQIQWQGIIPISTEEGHVAFVLQVIGEDEEDYILDLSYSGPPINSTTYHGAGAIISDYIVKFIKGRFSGGADITGTITTEIDIQKLLDTYPVVNLFQLHCSLQLTAAPDTCTYDINGGFSNDGNPILHSFGYTYFNEPSPPFIIFDYDIYYNRSTGFFSFVTRDGVQQTPTEDIP